MRRPLLVVRLWLCLLCLLCCAESAVAVVDSCQGPQFGRDGVAAGPEPRVLLPILGDAAFDARLCEWTFAELELGYANWRPCHHQGRHSVHTCPRHCSRVAATAPVFGSFPYHLNSSICLAGLHSGVISDDRGGAVLIERFYPATWSGDAAQTIFPHSSHLASLSNGVRSLEVPVEWRPSPSPPLSFAFTVRTRGAVASQRQTAPFPPRAQHLHLRFDQGYDLDHFVHHLIIGGRNATHYLNVHHTHTYIPPASLRLCPSPWTAADLLLLLLLLPPLMR